MAPKKKATKKKTKSAKKTPAKRVRNKPEPKSEEHVAFLVRVHPKTKQFIEDTAEQHGLSRDGFCRLLFNTAAASWDEFDQDAQQRMFKQMETSLENMIERVITEALENTPKNQIASKLGVRAPNN